MSTTIVRRPPAVLPWRIGDEPPDHHEVSLAGGSKSGVPIYPTIEVKALSPASDDDGFHRGGLRRDGERLWAPRRRMVATRKAIKINGRSMTQYQLAMATGLTVTAIANLERGRTRYPRMVTMERIAAALGVDLRWLCDE